MKGQLLLKRQKKKRGPASTPVTFNHLAFMEANVMARAREVDVPLCMLKSAETAQGSSVNKGKERGY
jgi:hypothetical protein